MMAKVTWAAAAVAAALLVLWLLVEKSAAPPAAGPEAAAQTTSQTVVGESAAAVPGGSAGPQTAVAAARQEVAPGAPAAGSAGDAASEQVRVLGLDGAPLAGVELRYSGPGTGPDAAAAEAAEFRRLRYDVESLLERFGRAATTDAAGIARWPRVDRRGFWTCGVRVGDAWGQVGFATTEAAGTVHDLQLQLDVALAVRVLDARQQSAADVLLEAAFASSGTSALGVGMPRRIELGLTDGDGNLLARHLQTWRDDVTPRGSRLPVALRVRLPWVDVEQEVDVASPPAQPVVLYLPPTGAVEVEARDDLAQPLASVRVSIDEEPRRESSRALTVATDREGRCRFPCIGLGGRLRLFLHLQQQPQLEQVVDGPRHAGEVVRVVLQPPPTPTLSGSLTFAGQPAAGVRFVLLADGSRLSGRIQPTDAEGRFRVAVTEQAAGKRMTAIECNLVDEKGNPDGRAGSWSGDLLLTPGEHDLGLLELRAAPLLAAGRLVTRSGTLPPGVGCIVEAATGDGERPWQSIPLRSRRLDADGTFELRGTAPNAPLRLRVETFCQCLPVPPLPFAAGAEDLRVELRQGGSVRASFLVGSYVAGFCLQPQLLPMAGASNEAVVARFTPGIDRAVPVKQEIVGEQPVEQACTWAALTPGRYRLLVGTRGMPTPLLQIDDVVVRDGECNEEARLQRLPLPGLKVLQLQLPQAAAILREAADWSRGAGIVCALDGETCAEQCWQVDSPLVVLASARPLDLLVRLTGHRDRVLRAVFEDQTIELQEGIAVTLQVAREGEGAGAATDAEGLGFRLTSLDDPLAAVQSWIYSPAAGGSLRNPRARAPSVHAPLLGDTAKLLVCRPGRYRLTARRQLPGGGEETLVCEPSELAVGEAGGTFAVRVAKAR